MSAAAVTRSVNMLKAHLNLRLINRWTRGLSLTEAGAEYLEECRRIIGKLYEVDARCLSTDSAARRRRHIRVRPRRSI